jgi:hypothetical protein
MLLEHGHEHLGVDDRAGVKQLHSGILAGSTRIITDSIGQLAPGHSR